MGHTLLVFVSESDPLYGVVNMDRQKKSIAQMETAVGGR